MSVTTGSDLRAAADAPPPGVPDLPPPAGPEPPAATDSAARRQAGRLLGPQARTGLLALLAVLVGVLLVRPPSAGAGNDFNSTAASLATAMAAQTGVGSASGGYLPGTGIVLVSSVEGVPSTQLNGILAASMGPFAAQLSALPDAEAVSRQSALTAADGTVTTWLIRVGADVVDDQSQWVAVPVAAAGGAAAGTVGAAATTSAAAPSPAATTSAAAVPGSSAAVTSITPTTATPTAAATSAAVTTSAAAGTSDGSAAAPGAAAGDADAGRQSDDFAGDATAWQALTGTWAIVDGTYQQSDAAGYDYISQFTSTLPAAYTVSVKMKGLADTVNGGLIIGQPALGSRKGATIVDLASKDYLRWGSYDASSSTYKFTGGAALGAAQAAGDWHTLSIAVTADNTVVSWDGKQVGTFAAIAGGSAGLVSSQSAVAFDDFTVAAS